MTEEIEYRECPVCRQKFPFWTKRCPQDGASLDEKQTSQKTLKLGNRYVVEGQLGKGGMGAIYKARHVTMDRAVAIKLLLGEISADPQSLARFQTEARAASNLSHPNIITVYEYDVTEDGAPYLVMELLSGSTLQETLEKHLRVSHTLAVNWFIQICSALNHAHSRNVVHRDLKPSNIMLVPDDAGVLRPVLVDFGIAKLFTPLAKNSKGLTQTGEVLGSPLYMSPEQCMGQPVDAKSDIYSFGCVMYETLIGVAPIQAESFLGLIHAHINDAPRPFKELIKDIAIPTELEEIVLKCLRKKPTERFASIQELQTALRSFATSDTHTGTSQIRNAGIGGAADASATTNGGGGAHITGSNDAPVPGGSQDVCSTTVSRSDEIAKQLGALAHDSQLNTSSKDDKLADYTRRATAGEAGAQSELAYLYYFGRKVDKDFALAYYWHKQAAEQGHLDSICALAGLYMDGEGVEKDCKEAFRWYRQAADNGHPRSQSLLAGMYEFAQGIDKDIDLAIFWHSKAAAQGHTFSMNSMGYFYDFGVGVEQNYETAAQWYLKAAEKGHADAQRNIGLCYASGRGVPVNYEEAATWYLCAAQQGNIAAKTLLAHCYEDGLGVAADEKEAVNWMQYAADGGNCEAQNHLAYWYENGLLGLPKDPHSAFKWYTKSALKKDAWAQYKLGLLTEFGDGVKRNEKQALDWYRRAAEQKVKQAQVKLAHCHRHGIGTQENIKEYIYWLEKAAEQKYNVAMFELGVYYEEDTQNLQQAVFWYTEAAESGHDEAKARLLSSRFANQR